ncbi:hypothetical protein [Aliamphritea spongicola]|nr:hypothetical protein [Aliamphritea spongicola]
MSDTPEILQHAIKEYENRYDGSFNNVPFILKRVESEFVVECLSDLVIDDDELALLIESLELNENPGFSEYCLCFPGSFSDSDYQGEVITLDYCHIDSEESKIYLNKIELIQQEWKASGKPWLISNSRNRFIKK